jgi:triacylglycerol lipase
MGLLLWLFVGCANPLDGQGANTDTSPTDEANPDTWIEMDSGAQEDATLACVPGQDTKACDRIGGLHTSDDLQYPLLLVHGMGGFDQLGPLTYFHQVAGHMDTHGYPIYKPVTDAWNSSEVRATQLGAYIDDVLACTCTGKVNLLGHSQGGIDARLLVAGMGYHDRVATVTTLAAPHHGTPVADVILGFQQGPAAVLANVFNIFFGFLYSQSEFPLSVQAALTSCSAKAMKTFNEEHPNHPDVAYYSYAGFTDLFANPKKACAGSVFPLPTKRDIVPPELVTTYHFLGGLGTPNDGLVTVKSARWGTFLGCVAADHLDQVGQIAGIVDSFQYKKFYLDHAKFLAQEGF